MKKIIKKMEELQQMLEEKLAARQEIFDSRSERWQESEKGEDYQEMTDRLEEMNNDLIDWQTELGS